MNKIENVITYLTKTKGLTIKGIIERLEYEGEPMQRILFTSWRRSTIPGRSDTLAKHGGSIRQYSNQVFNREIKKVCYAVGICDRVSITEYRRGQVLVSEHSKCDLVSSHTARRSFATNAILAGIPATDVMRFTGHKSMSAFLRYVRTSEQEVAIKYFNHPFFLGQ